MLNDVKYIGLDVHQATTSAAVLDAAGKLLMESTFETKASTILQFLDRLRGRVQMTFEEGTCAPRSPKPACVAGRGLLPAAGRLAIAARASTTSRVFHSRALRSLSWTDSEAEQRQAKLMSAPEINTRVRARWLRQRLEGKVPSHILVALTDEELVEQYEQEQRSKLERLKARNAPTEKE